MTNGIGRVGWRSFVPTNNPLWDNLKAYFTGDGTANDSKGTNNGTLTNGATYSTGKIGSGFSLDGVNDYVGFASTWFRKSKTEPFTISSWVNSSNHYGTIFSNGLDDGHWVFIYGQYIYAQIGNGNYMRVVSASTIPLNTFKHITITYNGNGVSGFKIYIDGVSNTVSTVENGLGTGDTPVIAYVPRIGTRANGSYPFGGIIDEVGIWDRVLTAAEVTELYNSGTGKQYVAPTPTYTTRTAAFATATGITDTTILNALNTFDAGLISNGLATKMKALYPFVGGTSATHKYNFMDARDAEAAFRLVFNGGWVHSSTGAQPNGTNGYANTNFNHVNNGNDKNNFGLTIYSRTNSTGFKVDIGAVKDAYSWIIPRASSTLDYVGIYDNSIFSGNFVTSSLGLFTCLRDSLTSQKFFQNGILKGQRTGFSSNQGYGTDININIYISCRNVYSVASNFSDRQLAFSGIHDSLTDAEALTFYNLVQAFQTSLSRQV